MRKLAALLLAICGVLTAMATDYDKMWKSVRAAQEKDMPKDAMALLLKINDAARRDKNYGEMLASQVYHARIEAEVTPDSLTPAISRIMQEALDAENNDPVLAAVYNTVLAKVCSLSRDNADATANNPVPTPEQYYDKALSSPDLLAATPTDAYKRLIEKGDDDGIYNHDLLSLIAHEAGRHDFLWQYYDAHGNRKAACVELYLHVRNATWNDDDQTLRRRNELLTEGMQKYADLPESMLLSYLYLQLMNEDIDITQHQKYDYATSAISHYSGRYSDGNAYLANLRNALQDLTSPRFTLSITDSIALRDIRNISQLKLEFLRLKCTGRDNINTYKENWQRELLRQADGYVSTLLRHYDEPSWKSHDETVALPEIPYGVYLVRATTADAVEYDVLYHTGLSVITMSIDKHGSRRIVAVDRKTGAPVAGAKVVLTEEDHKGNVKSVTTLITDGKGEAMFGGSFKANNIWVGTDADNTHGMDLAFRKGRGSYDISYYSYKEKRDIITLFTDRALYRPGQTLKGSVIVYNSADDADIHSVAGKELTVSIRNADYKEIYTTKVCTDTLGNAGFEFKLPTDGKNGMFSINCSAPGSSNGTASFRVEEYKRPTFEVSVEEPEQYVKTLVLSKNQNDTTITVRIKANTYSQIPVQNAQVHYSVSRSMQHFWWLRDFDIPNKNIVSSASAVTSDDGYATISFAAPLPLNDYRRYVFTLNASVTDKAGETHDVVQRIFVQRSRTADLSVTEEKEPERPKPEFEVSADRFPSDGSKVTFTMRNPEAGTTYAYYTIFAEDKVIESGQQQFDGEYKRDFTYRKAYGESLTIAFAWIRHGELHSYRTSIAKPEPDTKLPVRWTTFRDRTQPGSHETWTLNIDKGGKHPLSALTATIYDKSLDAIAPLSWSFGINTGFYNIYAAWQDVHFYSTSISHDALLSHKGGKTLFDYSRLNSGYLPYRTYYSRNMRRNKLYAKGGAVMAMATMASPEAKEEKASVNSDAMIRGERPKQVNYEVEALADEQSAADLSALVRTDLGETAFFTPSLLSDSEGNITLQFQLPETMTTWRMQGIVHDRQMHFAMLDTTCVAQKAIVVKPNVPRFLREGDKTVFAATVTTVPDASSSGKVATVPDGSPSDITVTMQLLHPETGKVVWQQKEVVSMDAGATAAVAFHAPSITADTLLIYRIAATTADGSSDGEQHYIPVCPAWEEVTTSVAFTQHEPGTYSKDISNLFMKGSTCRNVKVKYTPDAVQMIVDAIPSATHPQNKEAFSLATATYVATLFNENDTLRQNVTSELAELQLSDGSWAWWKGMNGSIWTTTTVARLLARLGYVHCGNAATSSMLTKALPFMAKRIAEEAEQLRKLRKQYPKADLAPSETALDILYVFAISGISGNIKAKQLLDANSKDVSYLISIIEKQSPDMTIYGKAHSAALLAYYGKIKTARTFLESMKQYSIYTDEAGRYYDSPKAYYSWRNYRIPTQVAAIEALRCVAPDDVQTVNEMKRWLLHEKRTQQWDNSVNTADAVFAFMLDNAETASLRKGKGGTDAAYPEGITVMLDGSRLTCDTVVSVSRARDFSVRKSTDGTSWGSVLVTQRVPLSSLKNHEMGFKVKREVISSGSSMRVGDRVTVRITIDADRDYDFVQVVDKHAACLEPAEQLSGYRSAVTGGTALRSYSGYYRQMRDNRTEFFFDRMAKGTHVIETDYYIDRNGEYQQGSCNVICTYAPEFNAVQRADGLSISN